MVTVWANGFGIFYLKSAAGTDPDGFYILIIGLVGIVVIVVDVEHLFSLFLISALYQTILRGQQKSCLQYRKVASSKYHTKHFFGHLAHHLLSTLDANPCEAITYVKNAGVYELGGFFVFILCHEKIIKNRRWYKHNR